jgi:hypothetical protein
MDLKTQFCFKKARQKYGNDNLTQPRKKKRCFEENVSSNLSILHSAYRNEEWVKEIKYIIYSVYEEVYLVR